MCRVRNRGASGFIRKPLSSIRSVCEPKIQAVQCLHDVLKQESLEFFILFSSVSAALPTLAVGQSDYAMANAYMDFLSVTNTTKGIAIIVLCNGPIGRI